MLLFDPSDVRVGYSAATLPGESLFQFLSSRDDDLNRNARFHIEKLLDRYPAAHRSKLITELRSKHDRQFYGALLEAVCWSLFNASELEPIVEPIAEGGSRPDFGVSPLGNRLVFVEATADLGEEAESSEQRAIHDLNMGATRHIDVPNYRLVVAEVRVNPAQPASPKAFGKFVNRLFTKMRDENDRPGFDDAVEFDRKAPTTWKDSKGNSVSFRPVYVSSDRRPKQLFAMGPMRGGFIDESRAVQRLKEKIGQHAKDPTPSILVFANCCSMRSDRDEFYAHRTLFGTERFHLVRPRDADDGIQGGDISEFVSYEDDGLWSQRRNTIEPAAVLWIEGLSPWRLADVNGRLWHNPRHELLGLRDTWRGRQAYFNLEFQLAKTDGESLGDMLDL